MNEDDTKQLAKRLDEASAERGAMQADIASMKNDIVKLRADVWVLIDNIRDLRGAVATATTKPAMIAEQESIKQITGDSR